MMRFDPCNTKNIPLSVVAKKLNLTTTEMDNFLKAPPEAQSLDGLKSLADILKCFPSELLPEDWQHPSLSLAKAADHIKHIIETYERDKTVATHASLAYMIATCLTLPLPKAFSKEDEAILKGFFNLYGSYSYEDWQDMETQIEEDRTHLRIGPW